MGQLKNVEWTPHLPPLLAAPPLPLLAASWRLYGVARWRPLFPLARPGPLPPPPPRPAEGLLVEPLSDSKPRQ
jgi:hypothetical protein